MARNIGPAPLRRGAAVVVRAWLGEGCSPFPWLDPGIAASPGGAGSLGSCCLSPAIHGLSRPGDLSAGADRSCQLIGPVAQSGCGTGVSACALSGLGDERKRISAALVGLQPGLQVARAAEVEQCLSELLQER